MSASLYLPPDQFSNKLHNFDLAADYLELTAFFSCDNQAYSQSITDALEEAAEEDYHTVDEEMGGEEDWHSVDEEMGRAGREEAVSGAIRRIIDRRHFLDGAYPFEVDSDGNIITFEGHEDSLGQVAYILSLILSNLRPMTAILNDASLHPTDEEIMNMRKYFQYFATAGLAAEIGGPAWSFGSPRSDGSGFIDKLTEIWNVLRDGSVKPRSFAPPKPKDDGVDVFAWREQRDGLAGFLLAAAQVATGKDWRHKSVKPVIEVFPQTWFDDAPVTKMIAYHIIPFTPDPVVKFHRRDVLVLGNILHRLRLPLRVMEAKKMVERGVKIEAFDQLPGVATWLMKEYRRRGEGMSTGP